MASTLIQVSLRASRGSSTFLATRLLSTAVASAVEYNYARTIQPPPCKPNLVVNGSSNNHNGVNGSTEALVTPTLLQPRLQNGIHVQEYSEPKSDLVVVLDMDECLIHSQFFSPHAAKLAHQLPHNHASSWNYSTSSSQKRVESFRFTLPDGDVVHVNKRPHLELFLEQVCSRFETHVFTAAMQVYAQPVLDHLDPNGTLFAKKWYRESCLYRDGAYVKDLSVIDKPLERMVLVDNNPLSFLTHPENGVLVNNFYNDPDDTTLYAVLDLLDELDQSRDVRPLLTRRFGLAQALEQVGSDDDDDSDTDDEPQAVASSPC